MRHLRKLWLDEAANFIEVRFDDGGCSIPIRGTSSERLIEALEYLIDTISYLERNSPYHGPDK